MTREMTRNMRLGAFVITGTVLLIAALYMIGNQQNLFGSTFRISAGFYNVNGLMEGNNVRFAGIDVGTVEKIEIINDTSVNVTMIIENRVKKFIRKNAIASVGTDGLMGNRLVNINSQEIPGGQIQEGDTLHSLRPIEMDEAMRTLHTTNHNLKVITDNLRNITQRISSRNSLWNLLMDTAVAENVKASVVHIKMVSGQSAVITGNLRDIIEDVKKGKGNLGALIADTSISSRITQAVVRFERISDTAALISGNVSRIIHKIESGQGSVGILLNDTSFVHNLNLSMDNIREGSASLNENLEALKYSWPFKKYFRKKKKQQL